MTKAVQEWPTPAPEDRRCTPRVCLELPLAVPVHVRSVLGSHRGIARNISEGGMLIELEEAPPIGSSVEITIAGGYPLSRTTETFVLTAEVRHQVAWSFIAPAGRKQLRGIGLRFVSAAPGRCMATTLH